MNQRGFQNWLGEKNRSGRKTTKNVSMSKHTLVSTGVLRLNVLTCGNQRDGRILAEFAVRNLNYPTFFEHVEWLIGRFHTFFLEVLINEKTDVFVDSNTRDFVGSGFVNKPPIISWKCVICLKKVVYLRQYLGSGSRVFGEQGQNDHNRQKLEKKIQKSFVTSQFKNHSWLGVRRLRIVTYLVS